MQRTAEAIDELAAKIIRGIADLPLLYKREDNIVLSDGNRGTRYTFGWWPWILLALIIRRLVRR